MALPDDYTGAPHHTELKNEICARIANGETLRSICREPGKPNFSTVYDWMDLDFDFAQRFARAREDGHDAIASDCLAIADDSGAEIVFDPETGRLKVDGEVVQRAKLRIDTRLKLLAKWNPKKYGESTQVKHADADGGKLGIAGILGALDGRSTSLPGTDEAPQ